MQPSDKDTEIVEKLFACGAIVLPSSKRAGWECSQIDGQAREYIIDREACVDALTRIQRIPWQSVDCTNKQLALTILDNARHSLTVMRDAMAKNEDKML